MLPVYKEYNDVIKAVTHLPCISIIMPFEPKMGQRATIDSRLENAVAKMKKEMLASYPLEQAFPVLQKLQAFLDKLNYNTHKKSIAIFVSPLVEKVYYLDITVEEKVVLDESFEIRDLIYNKKELNKYLVLVLSSRHTSIFLDDATRFHCIVSNTPGHTADNPSEPVGNFPDLSARKEVLLEKFLHLTDNGLHIILQSYPLPLFVMGTDRIIGHYKKLTKNAGHIVSYIHGNFEEAGDAAVRTAVAPHIADWKKIKETGLLHRIEVAAGAGKLVTGIDDVWKATSDRKGKLLVIEKSFRYPAVPGNTSDHLSWKDESTEMPFYIKDAVDDIIEKVLENGGDIEFVDEDALADYGKIALVQYY
jgi:hypothetical protein